MERFSVNSLLLTADIERRKKQEEPKTRFLNVGSSSFCRKMPENWVEPENISLSRKAFFYDLYTIVHVHKAFSYQAIASQPLDHCYADAEGVKPILHNLNIYIEDIYVDLSRRLSCRSARSHRT